MSLEKSIDNFRRCLEVGAFGEDRVIGILEQIKNCRSVKDVRADKRFQNIGVDIIVENFKRQNFLFEIKTDLQAYKTKNLTYETKSSKNIGCMANSKSDYIAYYIPQAYRLLLIKTKKLQEYVQHHQFREIAMGDHSRGYLISLQQLFDDNIISKSYSFIPKQKGK